MFYSGLAGLIGVPDPSVLTMEAMRAEHCDGPDHATIFLAATSGIRTTSLVEWWFVYDPEQEGLDEPRSKARLHEARRQLGLPSHRPWPQEPHRHVWIDPKTGRPPDGAWVPRGRVAAERQV